MKKNILIAFLALFLAVGCETTELEILDDPNNPGLNSLEPDALLSAIELNFRDFFANATESGAEATRLEYMFDEYPVNFVSNNANNQNMWTDAYSGVMQNSQALLDFVDGTGLTVHSGIAKTLRAYTLMTLVDYFGDVPFSEALQGGNGVFFPSVDDDQEVYQAVIADLDSALIDFAATPIGNPGSADLYYGGNVDKWIKLINSLKLKYWLNLRLVDEANAQSAITNLVSDGDFITDNADNFVFQFSTSLSPVSVHPYYQTEYVSNTSEYMPNYLIWEMLEEKDIVDPRINYYFYRQVTEFPTDPGDLNILNDCWDDTVPPIYTSVDLDMIFCWAINSDNGYWGRDHGDRRGIPPDNELRTTFGPYPVGGTFDSGEGVARPGDDDSNLKGAGLWPIMTSSYVSFMRAEAANYLNTGDDPKTMLTDAVSKSIEHVMTYNNNPGSDSVPTSEDIEAYIATISDMFDAAAGQGQRMAVIGKEYHIALFGNGVEAYNLYRRTGTPMNMQPTLLGNTNFPRTFFYPGNVVDANPNISQKSGFEVQVFWDNNPAGFIY